jgi:hypothetical protein
MSVARFGCGNLDQAETQRRTQAGQQGTCDHSEQHGMHARKASSPIRALPRIDEEMP